MENYCISLDWLQVCGYSQDLALLNNPPTSVGIYELQVSEQGTRTFQRLVKRLSELRRRPCRAGFRSMPSALVRLASGTLYRQNGKPCAVFPNCLFTCLINILRALNIRYKGITRIDFAYDCKLTKGRRISRTLSSKIRVYSV